MDRSPSSSPWEELLPFISEKRQQRMQSVAENRTHYLRLVIQDIVDPHNISACIRSAEAFGIQEIFVVGSYKKSDVSRGSASWLNISCFKTIKACADQLRKDGFKICIGYPPHSGVVELGDIELDQPLAFVFGNEHAGVSPEWSKYCDVAFTIPMFGMVESLNISVSAAITMFTVRQKLNKSSNKEQMLIDATQKQELLDKWALKGRENIFQELQSRKK